MAIADLAADLACALDPVRLAEQAGITPDPWQAEVLRSGALRVLLLCSRQAGKSTITSILAVHVPVYEPGSLVLLLSPTLRQSGELFKKCGGVYQALGRPVPPEGESALQLELENGSRRTAAASGAYLRGNSTGTTNGGGYWLGRLAYFAAYNHALSADRVLCHWTAAVRGPRRQIVLVG